jgi:prevent-host-death family protein
MASTEPATQFNIHEAKTHLSRLVERAAAGEEIIISKAGRPVARLGPIPRATTPRKPGRWRGRVRIHHDFDELPPDLAAAFRGERP